MKKEEDTLFGTNTTFPSRQVIDLVVHVANFATFLSKAASHEWLEKDIFEQYKSVMKNMTKSQEKMLLKLINRETDQTSFNIVKAFLGSFRAGFWQTFGRFFGLNMKSGFHPDKNKDDAMIERIATLIEQGAL
ncbi:MAG: DUF4294 domain-containing protein [Bacteroides sp.]|nr:DUF4294 domain-containing protein [Bacteroides sp.]